VLGRPVELSAWHQRVTSPSASASACIAAWSHARSRFRPLTNWTVILTSAISVRVSGLPISEATMSVGSISSMLSSVVVEAGEVGESPPVHVA
jgi:hypothetical protein